MSSTTKEKLSEIHEFLINNNWIQSKSNRDRYYLPNNDKLIIIMNSTSGIISLINKFI